MGITLITINPEEKRVEIRGAAANDVSMASVDPQIRYISFNEEVQSGEVLFWPDPETGVTPPPEVINSLDPWQEQITQAETIIFCYQNPKTFYSTVDPIGSPILVYEEGWPQPSDSTEQIPPDQPSSDTTLYWDGDSFVWSSFPYTLSLSDSKSYLKKQTDEKAYEILQPSDWYTIQQLENGVPIPDEWKLWRQSVRDAAQNKKSAIDSKNTKKSLNIYSQSDDYLNWPTPPQTE